MRELTLTEVEAVDGAGRGDDAVTGAVTFGTTGAQIGFGVGNVPGAIIGGAAGALLGAFTGALFHDAKKSKSE